MFITKDGIQPVVLMETCLGSVLTHIDFLFTEYISKGIFIRVKFHSGIS